jgi:hypothetical protein
MKSVALLAGVAFAASVHAADENKDLDLIPQSPTPLAEAPAAPAVSSHAKLRLYVEDAASFASLRDGLLVPPPPPPPPRWENRLFADARAEWTPRPDTTLVYSGRLNLLAAEDLGWFSRGNVNHDLRELYASFEPQTRDYIDIGRINVKSGVALGFNPTDFFKARAVVDPLTADPRALREDRLGTLMVGGQHLGEKASVSVAYAPRVTDPAPVAVDPDRFFDPLFGRTNGTNRVLVKASALLADGVNPEALLFWEDGRYKAGLNFTETIGQAVVVYAEWSGGKRLGIIDEALAFGRRTGTIPPAAPDVITQGGEESFKSQAAIGASYTTETKITVNLEYHYNGAGFSRADWDRWFALGEGRPGTSPVNGELWYVRAYAADRQEPLAQHSVFLRLDWVDFLVPKLELSGFVSADARDGSTLMQVQADYAASDHWSFGLLATGTTGGRRSNFGSLQQESRVLVRATRYF